MKKVEVLKNSVVTNIAYCQTQQVADAWIAKNLKRKAFGKPERWVSEDRISLEGESVENAAQMIIEPILGKDVKLYKFLADYSIQVSDVSQLPANTGLLTQIEE